jgi:hypothetical protein
MARQLYYRDSYGQVHRDRQAERGRQASRQARQLGRGPSRFFVRALLVLAAIVVLASLVH